MFYRCPVILLRAFLPVLVLLLLCVTSPAQQSPQQNPPEQKQTPDEDEPIKLDTSLVVMNVTVTDLSGKYVTGLRAQDFSIFEDKGAQKIASFSFEEMPFAAVILLDISGSMGQKMALARAACSNFIEGIRDGDVVAVYTFGGLDVKKIQDFSEVRSVDPLLWETKAKDMTPLYDGLVKAAEELAKRPERRRAIIILSDGADTSSRNTLEKARKKVIDGEIAIYAVDLSDTALYRTAPRDTGQEVLKSLAMTTGGRFFPSPGGRQLRDAFEQTINELRNQYTIAYEPTNDKKDGKWRIVEVRTKAGQNVRTRQGYYAPKEKK